MKLSNSTILAIVVAGGFSLTAYVMGQQGTSLPTNAGQNVQAGQNLQGQTAQGAAKPDTTIQPLDSTSGQNTSGVKSAAQQQQAQKVQRNTQRKRSASASTSAAPTATTSPKTTAPPEQSP